MTVVSSRGFIFHGSHVMGPLTFSSVTKTSRPTCIINGRKLHTGVREHLLHYQPETTSAPEVNATIVDGTAVVQMLDPALARTFGEYSSTVVVSYQIHFSINWRRSTGWLPPGMSIFPTASKLHPERRVAMQRYVFQ